MVSVSGTSSATTAKPVSPAIVAANKTVSLLIQSTDVQQALSSKSSHWIPATANQVLSTLWALFNTSGSHTIAQADVQQAVLAEGGKPSDATALWRQLDTTHKGFVNPNDFAGNAYLIKAINADLPAAQKAIATLQQQQGPTASASVLGCFQTAGGTGNTISQVGNPYDLNIFV